MTKRKIQIIAGRPSSGKTLYATHISRISAIQLKTVIYFSFERTSDSLRRLYGIQEEVEVVDIPSLTWEDIKAQISGKDYDLCVVDYLQLLQGYNSGLLNVIVEEFEGMSKLAELIILAQVSVGVESESRLPCAGDIFNASKISKLDRVIFTGIGKT